MRFLCLAILVTCLLWAGTTGGLAAAEPAESFRVWPDRPPAEARDVGEERLVEGRPRPFYQITGVSQPTVSVYLPPQERRTGAALLLLPGGGLQRLAIEHEGFEVAEWLVAQDIAVFLLKYRVPAPAQAGLQDAQRALRLVRSRAAEWGVDPEGIGVLGFSAGGEIAAWMVTHHKEPQYDAVDDLDALSSRPAFAGLVYPGGLLEWRSGDLKQGIVSGLDRDTPALFLAHTFEDSCQNSLELMLALKKARVPAELHLFQEGGHAFGVRSSGLPLASWKDQFVTWMRGLGFLDSRLVREYARELARVMPGAAPLPKLSERAPAVSLREAYEVQDRLVRMWAENEFGGFKGAVVSPAAMKTLGITEPLMGVLPRSGRLEAADKPRVDGRHMVETEIGFLTSVDLSYEVLNDVQAQGAVESVLPVIELPLDQGARWVSPTAADLVAMNIGSARYIVGTAMKPEGLDLNPLRIRLERDGALLHETTAGSAAGGQWGNLRNLINQLVRRGHTIPKGTLIISGALGGVHPGEAGGYLADFGRLGTIEFGLSGD